MRTILYGGTFNPPHTGHLAAAETAMRCLAPDRFIWMPAGRPPHKPLSPGTPSERHRLEMCEMMAEELPGSECSDLEMRLGLSYTADTLKSLAEELPGAEITLLVGEDMLLSLDTWRRPEELLSSAAVAVLTRSGRVDEVHAKCLELRRDYDARVILLPHEPVLISSSELRAKLSGGYGREYLVKPVFNHIIINGLYQL